MKKIKNIYHYLFAWFSNILYGNPSRDLTVIGVTGTKGKTSTVELIAAALNACNGKAAAISSAHVMVAGEEETNQGRFEGP